MLKKIITFCISLIVFMTTVGSSSIIDMTHQEEDFYCIEVSNFYNNLKSCDYIIDDFFEKNIKKIDKNQILYNDLELSINRIELFKEILEKNDIESKNINELLNYFNYIKDDYIKTAKDDDFINQYLKLYKKIEDNIKSSMIIDDYGELKPDEYIEEKYKTNLIKNLIEPKNQVLLNFVEIVDGV